MHEIVFFVEIFFHLKNTHFCKDFQCAIDQIEASEVNCLLRASNNQNHVLLKFWRIFKPICVVRRVADHWNPIRRNGCKIAINKWPKNRRQNANNLENKHDKIEMHLEKEDKLMLNQIIFGREAYMFSVVKSRCKKGNVKW